MAQQILKLFELPSECVEHIKADTNGGFILPYTSTEQIANELSRNPKYEVTREQVLASTILAICKYDEDKDQEIVVKEWLLFPSKTAAKAFQLAWNAS